MEWQEYKEKIPQNYTAEDLSLIKKAFEFASEIHKDEKRLTDKPYIVHPAAVSLEVSKLKIGAPAVAAALLHDTYESNPTVLKRMHKEFVPEIAFLVKGLSKVDKIQYKGMERSAESTRKMFMAMAQDVRVIIIKLLDRLNNLETLHVLPAEKQKRIAMETLEIFAPVADRLGMGDIKLKLEDSAFKYAFPEEYKWITKETREKIPEREKYLKKKIIPLITEEIKKEKINPGAIQYRAKHYYSLWKKLLKNNMDWYIIYDLAAVRIIVESVEECYRVLGIIHKLWKPLPGRIKDYIALPKQNGYQSLHTTVFCVNNKVTEFQIRTQKMHEEAECGIAAHWAWEMAGKPTSIGKNEMPHQKFAWIKQLREWQKKFNKEEGRDFLESLKIDFFKDRIFVLTPHGDIIDLPEGATPIDFAYHIHSKLGNSITGAKINSRIVPLSHELSSGDIVEILTQKGRKPNIKMVDYAKTSLAKKHIRSATKKHQLLYETEDKKENMKAELNLTVEDRIGMIKDITSLLSLFRINIESLVTKEKETANNNYAVINLTFSAKNKTQIEKIATRLKTIKGVEEISPRSITH